MLSSIGFRMAVAWRSRPRQVLYEGNINSSNAAQNMEGHLLLLLVIFFGGCCCCCCKTLARCTGYYAGWLTSAFMLGRLTTGYAWGIFADRYGRKPVLVIGMISAAVCSIGFGLSTSFATALLWR